MSQPFTPKSPSTPKSLSTPKSPSTPKNSSTSKNPSTPKSPPMSPIGPKEESQLQLYFELLSQFAFDKAKDIMDKEKEIHKASFGSSWALMVHSLIQFSVAEKTYMSLGFLEQKWFGRKDSLRNSYHLLLGELRRIEDSVRQQEHIVLGLPGPMVEFELLLSHLCGQLCEYIRARQKTMDFYEQISMMGTNKNMNYQDLVDVIAEIIHVHSKNFHHPILAGLKTSFTCECDVINHLLQSQILMCQAEFLQTLLQLHQAHSKLTSWGSASQAKEGDLGWLNKEIKEINLHEADDQLKFPSMQMTTKKGMFGHSSKTVSTWPALYQWLLRYKSLLVAKFSLYFYDVLSKQTTTVEMKSLSAKNVEDFSAKVIAFQKKTDALNVSLVLDTQDIEHVYKGPGYHHPDKHFEPPTGLESYPAIYSYPGDHPANHWPNVVMMISDRTIETEKVTCIYDKGIQNTYFIINADPKIYIVVIYESKKSEKDSYVNNFLIDLSSMLRCAKHFATLKPGSRVGSRK